VTSTKSQVRAAILVARRSVSRQTRDTETADLMRHLAAAVVPRSTVCAYVPVGSEPGSVALIDDLVARHIEVLLPVARESADGIPLPLQWGRYTPGDLAEAPFGLREPRPPRLPAETVTTADVVLVPALAVDRDGARLGRGAGYYDRTLALARPDTLLVAVVRDEELVDHLPSEAHDVRMTHALTPGQGLVTLR